MKYLLEFFFPRFNMGAADKFYRTIEYKVNDVDKLSIPDWKPKANDYQYTGKTFTGSKNIVLPEYFQETKQFVDGDNLNIIDSKTGTRVEKYIYDIDTDEKCTRIG